MNLDLMAQKYINDGYLIVPEIFDQMTVENIHAEIPKFLDGTYPVSNPSVNNDSGLLAVHFPHWVSQPIFETLNHPKIKEILQIIVGAHIPHWDGRVKCMQSMLFLKPSGFPGQAWHQDERFIATRDRSLVGVWIALDDATVDNGCLRVIPGSHKMGQLWPTRQHDETEEFDPSDESYGFNSDDEEILEVEAGSAVFFNGYLLHRSLRNVSDTNRRALVHHYMNAWSNLPWQIGADRLVDAATHDHRMIVPVAGNDPYPERGIEASPNEVFLRPWGEEMEWGDWDA